MNTITNRVLVAALFTTACLASTQASAVNVNRTTLAHGAANCQSALPTFDGNIRKRPKAIANEGSSTAFVTCGFEQIPNISRSVAFVQIYFLNRNESATMVNCTMVDGFQDQTFTASLTKTLSIPTSGSRTQEWRDTTDNASEKYTFPAISCGVPPGVEISGTVISYSEDIGA